MTSSLHQLLVDDGFQHRDNPIYIFSLTTSAAVASTSTSNNNTMKTSSVQVQPDIDQVVVNNAVVNILSSYVGRYLKDQTFRQAVMHNFSDCFRSKIRVSENDADSILMAKLELGIGYVDEFVEGYVSGIHNLKESMKLLTLIASLNSQHCKNRTICGIPNSILSASAQFYMAVVYKIQKNDRICARHLLQVFCDSPLMARTRLIPCLWEQLFLPHLLHIKVWYTNELDLVWNSDDSCDKERMINSLCKVYNDQMDLGTSQFAIYYKKLLKVGASEPSLPFVPLPVGYGYSLSRTSSGAVSSISTAKRSLYSTVFGSENDQLSMDLDYQSGSLVDTRQAYKPVIPMMKGVNTHTKSISRSFRPAEVKASLESQKVSSFQFLNCHSIEPAECLNSGTRKLKQDLPSNDLTKAIQTICSSNSLSNCEIAVRVIAKALLVSRGVPLIKNSLSKPPVIVGILEVLFGSESDEILELGVSLLSELVSIKKALAQVILNSDPQLEIFIKLLKSSSLFLKASVLLYLVNPTAKHMISPDWIPLSLRVLEFGDQLQTLFSVRNSPEVAALYFLEQLLKGFDEVKNSENARQLVSVGGLSLLVKMLDREKLDTNVKHSAVTIIYYCLQADRTCRTYLVGNLNIPALFELLILKNPIRNITCALPMITELLCIDRRCSRSILLSGLLNKGGKLNLMQLLLVHLHRALLQEQPFVAVILLQLDLLEGDTSKYSVYKSDAVDTIIEMLKVTTCRENLQEYAAKALLMLGGRFTHRGDSCVESWILKLAGFTSSSSDSVQGNSGHGNNLDYDDDDDDEAEISSWQRKLSIALFSSGKERLMSALSDAMSSGNPALARASLVTISWMSIYLCSIEDQSIIIMAVSALTPHLLKCLNYARGVKERVMASFSILNLSESSGMVAKLLLVDEKVMSVLNRLSSETWTARKLMTVIASNPM